MKNNMVKLALLAAITLGSIASVQAAPVTYDFTATDFLNWYGSDPTPYNTISGDFTIDGNVVTDIHLTLGSHSYAPADVGTNGLSIIGGNACGIDFTPGYQCITAGTDDFWIQGGLDGQFPYFANMYFSIVELQDTFYTTYGAIKVRQSNGVPEPGTFALLAIGALGVTLIKRTRRGHSF